MRLIMGLVANKELHRPLHYIFLSVLLKIRGHEFPSVELMRMKSCSRENISWSKHNIKEKNWP
jgi:hypothetical protein